MRVDITFKPDVTPRPTLCVSSASACGQSKRNPERAMPEGRIPVLTDGKKAKSQPRYVHLYQ